MRTAKISELKAKLSAHIEYVKAGEEVLIFDRNTPVARLVAAEPVDQDYDERTRRMIAKGILTPPKKPRVFGKAWPAPTGAMISREVMEQIWREERDGR
jgi:prevent-host-death family protein